MPGRSWPWILVALAASVLPMLAPGGLRGEARIPPATPALLVALLCVQTQLRQFQGAAWRAWRWIRLSLVAWILFDVGSFFADEHDIGARGAAAVCLAAFFVSFSLALDWRPQLAAAQEVPATAALERVGSVVFAFGALLYATALPSRLRTARSSCTCAACFCSSSSI